MAPDVAMVRTRAPRGLMRTPRIATEPDELAPFLSDAAHFPGGRAAAICFPESEAEVAAALRVGPSVLCIGAQSSVTGGATPHGEILLSTARLDRIIGESRERIRVGPGLVLQTLLDHLRLRGKAYPPVPTYDGATVGGTVATNAAGAATFKYGTTRAWIDALTIVLACGEALDLVRGEVQFDTAGRVVIRHLEGRETVVHRPRIRMPSVPKVSCGYASWDGMDLIDLFIGAEGTLGVVTEIELRLLDPAPALLLALVPLASEEAALALTAALRQEAHAAWQSAGARGVDVAAIEYLDTASLTVLAQDRVAERMGLVALPAQGTALLVHVELPPGTTNAEAMAAIAAEAPTRAAGLSRFCHLLEGRGALAATAIALPEDEVRQAAFRALREAVPDGVNRRIDARRRESGEAISKAAADVIVPFEQLGVALADYRAVAARHQFDIAIWGHVSDGNVHPNLLPVDGESMQRARLALREIGQAAIARGGAPMSEHGVGRNPIKQVLLRDLYGVDGIASMQAVKQALDPDGILAPGVLWPARAHR